MALFKILNKRLLMQAVYKYSSTQNVDAKRVCKAREQFDPIPVAPPGHQIKICSAEHLQQVCPPEPCKCPLRKPPLTNAERTRLTLLLLAKMFIFFIIFNYTNELGIWTTSDKTEELYGNMYTLVEPIFTDPTKPRRGPVQLLNPTNLIYDAARAWNRGVIKFLSLFGLESYPDKPTDTDERK